MATQEKKMAAALAAVSAFMQQEQEALQEAIATALTPSQKPLARANVWGQSGRLTLMQMRNLMQVKAFHRF